MLWCAPVTSVGIVTRTGLFLQLSRALSRGGGSGSAAKGRSAPPSGAREIPEGVATSICTAVMARRHGVPIIIRSE